MRFIVSCLFVLILFISCVSEEEMQCSPIALCTKTGMNYELCCSSDDCFYKAGSENFECESINNCLDAAKDATVFCENYTCVDVFYGNGSQAICDKTSQEIKKCCSTYECFFETGEEAVFCDFDNCDDILSTTVYEKCKVSSCKVEYNNNCPELFRCCANWSYGGSDCYLEYLGETCDCDYDCSVCSGWSNDKEADCLETSDELIM